ncbi:bifunctional diguanylate cyclase/phosphodiesterase [Pseudoduganella violacea]|uniref:Diguanylate cyclase (GGDEF)-like protein/PAS domain S-box-containing protein n=1 Tax=Pseudoduganella violacea TaxID=1715466 RepID=A0A7W5B641_9BURK|nr:EAL domain-containing protein [Pseudoduganella violacea]MBB3117267.1 diguanylate cyclase (GGDEF)-like protein/PAS domain S-box-containing protein [Pseudoduganella violacea]
MSKQRSGKPTVQSNAYLRFRQRLIAGLLTMAVLATAIVVWEIHTAAQEREQAIARQTQHYTRAIEAQVLSTIEFVDLSLTGFSNALKLLPADHNNVNNRIAALLSSRGSSFQGVYWLAFIDAQGQGVAASNDLPIAGTDFSQRDYFQAHLQNKVGNKLFIGEPILSHITKSRLFVISRRVENAEGKFLGVIAAPLDARRFAEVFEKSRLGKDVSISLVHMGGHLIARAPQFERTFRWDLRNNELFKRVPQSKNGTFTTISPIDHVSRVFSYAVLQDFPLIVVSGSSDTAIGLAMDRHIFAGVLGLTLLLGIMLAGGHFALRSYAKVEERESRYRQLYVRSRDTEAKLTASEQRLRLIADNLPIMIAYVTRDGRYSFTNRRFEERFGQIGQSLIGKSAAQTVGQELYQIVLPHLDKAFGGQNTRYERKVLTSHGERWDSVCYVPDFDDKGQVVGLFSMVEDITNRKKHEESMKLAALMYQNSSEGMLVTDEEGTILSVNPAFSRISGYEEREVVGRPAYQLTAGLQDREFFSRMRQSILHTGRWEGEIWHQHKNGEHYLVALRFDSVCDENAAAYRRVALFSDVTKRKASEELIWKQANFDALTGLPNRRMFNERLNQELKKSQRHRLSMALLFIDLDGFKGVNDTLGHAMGDVLLQKVAQRLGQCVRSSDTVARLGGDEFTIILSEVHQASAVLRVVRDVLAGTADSFDLGKDQVQISASIGITSYPDDGEDAETLLKNADQAMYAAKQQGRNGYHYFAPAMQEGATLKHELRQALENNELRLVYQPVIALASGRMQKVEALLRWQHPSRGLLTPAEFLAAAEHSGAIVGIGDWIFRQAVLLAQRLQAEYGPNFQVCVNKSALQFRSEDCNVESWLAFLRQRQVDARSIVIEVTEKLLMDANSQTTGKLKRLQEAGMQLALDDFGTGYCSVSFLRRFQIDYLKIDPAFIANLDDGIHGQELCRAIIAMAHTLGIQVIAEGIEHPGQLAILKAAGSDFGQGNLLSEPVSEDKLEKISLVC